MGIMSLTLEKIEELNKAYEDKKREKEAYETTTEIQLWKKELLEFMDFYKEWLVERENDEKNDDFNDKKKGAGGAKKPKKIKKATK